MLNNYTKKQKYITGIVLLVLIVLIISFKVFHKSNDKRPAVSVPRVAYVQITEDGFTPTALKISAGTEVIWTNSDTEVHSIEAAVGSNYQSLNSNNNMDTHGTYRYTFDKKGTYNYHDKLHPMFNGSIIVQ